MTAGVHKKSRLFIIVFTSLFQCSVAQFLFPCPTNFENTVKYVDDPFLFPSEFPIQQPNWEVAPADQAFDSLKEITDFNNSTVLSPFETTYAVDASKLTIFTSTVEQEGTMPYATAGIYLANYMDSECTASASLTVIESGPLCSCDATSSPDPTLYCEVIFSNYVQQRIRPIMTWIDSTGTIVFTDDQLQPISIDFYNQGLQYSVSQYQIDEDDDSTYQCNMTFSAPDEYQPPMIAENAPAFIATCVTSNT